MNKSVAFLFLSSSLLSNFYAFSMEEEDYKPSCEEQLYKKLAGGNLERMLTAKSIARRTFTPFTLENFEEAQVLFAKKGVLVSKMLLSLQEDPHLVEIAKRAKLNGLCVVENETKEIDGIVHDAFTGVSITQFKDAAIYHALAIPQLPDQINNNPGKRVLIVQGIIEREIARISKAYTDEDDELVQWKHMLCTRIPYCIGSSILGFCFPPSLIITVPLGFFGSTIQKEITRFLQEVATDRHAVELAQRSDNLIATLETTNELMNESNKKMAQALEEGDCNISERVQRIHALLDAQNELKKVQ